MAILTCGICGKPGPECECLNRCVGGSIEFPFRPFSDRVLVTELKDVREIEGVTIPDTTQEKPERIGIVMSVGPKVEEATIGQHVSFGPYSGRPYVVNGEEFVLLREGELSGEIRLHKKSS